MGEAKKLEGNKKVKRALMAFCFFWLILLTRSSSAQQQSAWFLMVAPQSKVGYFRLKAPLKEWSHIASFDSAKECELRRNVIASKLIKDSSIPEKNEEDRRGIAWAALSCVPFEMIREAIR